MTDFSKYIGKLIEVVIDRPLGTKHPKHDIYYEVNYGYVPDTISGDGEEIDVYLLGESKPVERSVGKCIAIIHRLDDDDDKLIVATPGAAEDLDDGAIMKMVNFQEKYFKSKILR
ncbi:MAG: inorganic diphosphatase [Candidatus Berkelbacteria bacterium]